MKKGRVLIVDDDLDIRETMAEVLADEGFDVAMAANGQDALTLLRGADADRPHVILLDLMMPILDGYEFVEEQRRDAELAAIPVVVVTAGPNVDRQRLGAGLQVLTKPIELGHLFRLLDELPRK